MTPRIYVTCGDVNGIGLECFIKAARTGFHGADVSLLVHPNTLKQYIRASGQEASFDGDLLVVGESMIPVISIGSDTSVEFGRVGIASGSLAIAALEAAAAAVGSGLADAVVTLPISKEACSLAGFHYPGQTEFFGDRWNGSPLMILFHHHIRVALATVHIPLRSVAQRLSADHISERIVALARSLHTDFAITTPTIAVLGFNPHAGENGTIGLEEETIIEPAMQQALNELAEGVHLSGPVPADGFFGFGGYTQTDGILAMYHDQGLIPLKILAKGCGVNFTAGLRHVRTSPDHGTAFDIVGTNVADPTSTIEAIVSAAQIVQNRRALT